MLYTNSKRREAIAYRDSQIVATGPAPIRFIETTQLCSVRTSTLSEDERAEKDAKECAKLQDAHSESSSAAKDGHRASRMQQSTGTGTSVSESMMNVLYVGYS